MPPQRMPCHPGNNEKWRKGDKQTHTHSNSHTYTYSQRERQLIHTTFIFQRRKLVYYHKTSCWMRRTRRRRLQPNGRMLATAARAGGWGRGGRVMRKSRVVNLCDNILCETFLFLVQRELQRSTAQGRLPHPRRAGERRAGVLGSL